MDLIIAGYGENVMRASSHWVANLSILFTGILVLAPYQSNVLAQTTADDVISLTIPDNTAQNGLYHAATTEVMWHQFDERPELSLYYLRLADVPDPTGLHKFDTQVIHSMVTSVEYEIRTGKPYSPPDIKEMQARFEHVAEFVANVGFGALTGGVKHGPECGAGLGHGSCAVLKSA